MIKALFLLAVISCAALSCTSAVKPASSEKVQSEALYMSEPAPEVEQKIKLKINFDGKWQKQSTGSGTIILIHGKTGRIIGKNGAEIPIIIRYLDEATVKILEYDYNPEYLSNWLPMNIAKQIYLNSLLKNTYSILRIVNDDTLKGTSYAWQVFHSGGNVQRIEPLVTTDEWKRVKDK